MIIFCEDLLDDVEGEYLEDFDIGFSLDVISVILLLVDFEIFLLIFFCQFVNFNVLFFEEFIDFVRDDKKGELEKEKF